MPESAQGSGEAGCSQFTKVMVVSKAQQQKGLSTTRGNSKCLSTSWGLFRNQKVHTESSVETKPVSSDQC